MISLTPAVSRRLAAYVQGLDFQARVDLYTALEDAPDEAAVLTLLT